MPSQPEDAKSGFAASPPSAAPKDPRTELTRKSLRCMGGLLRDPRAVVSPESKGAEPSGLHSSCVHWVVQVIRCPTHSATSRPTRSLRTAGKRIAVGRAVSSASPRVTGLPPVGRSAREAGLRYGADRSPGIRRRRAGRAFAFLGPDGRPVSPSTRERIRRLVIPPAWTDVWIAPDPLLHLQATGRDARGRK